MTAIVMTSIGSNREKPRLWLEGRKLEREGFTQGETFKLEDKGDHFVLIKHKDGDKTVSARKGKGAIIDITADYLKQWFDVGQKIRAAIRRGKIIVKKYFRDGRIARRIAGLYKAMQENRLTTASAFHGGGVMSRALHEGMAKAGANSFVQVAVELEAKYLDSSLRNNSHLFDEEDSVVIEGPIQDVCLDRAPEVNVFEAGIPCTGASPAGRAKGNTAKGGKSLSCAEEHDSAGALFFNTLQWIDKLNPAVVVLENVKAYQSTASMMVLRSTLQSLGYAVHERVFDCGEYALEARQRLVIVAVTHGLETLFDIDAIKPLYAKPSLLGEVLEAIPSDSPRWKAFDYLKEKEKRDIANGKGFRRQLFDADSKSIGTVTRQYMKCRSTDPFIKHPSDAELTRLLTVTEHATVKGAPTELVQGLSDTVAHEVLGQGIVYPLFVAVGKSIGESLSLANRLALDDALTEQSHNMTELHNAA